MSLKKSILIIASLVTVSCHKAHKPDITTNFDTNFEILSGKVKQLSETYKGRKYSQPDTHIIDFDVHGNVRQVKTVGDCNCLVTYKYQHDKNGKKTEVIVKNDGRLFPFIYRYDANGRIVELTVDTKMLKLNSDQVMQDKFFYKYDAAGNRIQEDYYLEQEHKYHSMYRYNDKHLLVEEDYFLSDNKKPESKTIYHYPTFDSQGNWLIRIANDKENYNGLKPNMSADTITRKITYY